MIFFSSILKNDLSLDLQCIEKLHVSLQLEMAFMEEQLFERKTGVPLQLQKSTRQSILNFSSLGWKTVVAASCCWEDFYLFDQSLWGDGRS